MVYVDPIFDYGIKGNWCHMWADTEKELDEMALKIGLNPNWKQKKNRKFIHFDLRQSKRILAIQNGAFSKSLREWIKEGGLNK